MGKNKAMRIYWKGNFTANQKATIREAARIAADSLPMPKSCQILRVPANMRKLATGLALPRKVFLSGNRHGADMFIDAAHELRHVSDYFTGKLEALHDGWRWNGRKITEATEWENRRFEKVAITFERRAAAKRNKG
jgi:hypothetical protein